jgi:hypothetical protein
MSLSSSEDVLTTCEIKGLWQVMAKNSDIETKYFMFYKCF